MRARRFLCLAISFVVFHSLFAAASVASADDKVSHDQSVDFNRDVRSILSDNCFLCHGPDEETREGDLRLDSFEQAVDASGAVVPGKASESELIARITSRDPDLVMPPPASGKSLDVHQIDTLKRWVNEGAAYEDHWAFQVPQRPTVPATDSKWPRNPIDNFVLRRLQENGLKPTDEVDKGKLIRRLSLDLTGLPPVAHGLNLTAETTSATSIDQVCEQLLDDEAFGEHWARWWLDAARYADSDGYEKDKPREVWFYRDWVINALNENKPYDEFIVEQIAGDLLPGASQTQIVATGFLRNSMINEEGGADPEQFRVEGMFDRMDAIGKAVLGLTTQCAQCHTHKYDPLSHKEYYQMFAALNDFHEAIMTVYTPEQLAARDAVFTKIHQVEEQLKADHPNWQERFADWQNRVLNDSPDWKVLVPTDRPFEGEKFRPLPDGSIISESYAPTKSATTFKLVTNLEGVTAFRLEALTHPQLPHNGPGRSILGTGALTEFEVDVSPVDQPSKVTRLKFVKASATVNADRTALPAFYRDRNPDKDNRVTGPIEYAIDGDSKTAWTTDAGPGRRNVDHQAVFVLSEPIALSGDVTVGLRLVMKHGGWNSDDNQSYHLGRYRFSATTSPEPDTDVVPESVRDVLKIPQNRRSIQQQQIAFRYFRQSQDEYADFNRQIADLWKQHPEGHSQLVARALPRPRKSYIFARGDFLNPTEQVTPGVPAVLGALPDSDEPDRLKFARWMVSNQNPTTARAVVNRIWQSYFGTGLVETPEDLGYQSAAPSHPDLLDWLSVELIESGWSLKHIHKLIVWSATYRQSSLVEADSLARDPYNRLLGRGSRFRVNAEVVRDQALAVSGLLNDLTGGPSVYPEAPLFLFQPPASYGPKIWNTSSGEDAFRRSLYVHSFRSVPYPPLQVFDAPKGDAACVRRSRSNTPLQALTVLNEAQFVECARAFAGRILRDEPGSDVDKIRYAFRLATSRDPGLDEVRVLNELLTATRKRLKSGDLDAEQMMAANAGDAADSLQEMAAWFSVARAILNLDETVTRD